MSTEKSQRFCQACIVGDLSAVSRMLQEDPMLANSFGMVRPDHREFMKQQNAEDGWTALHLAAHYGQSDVVTVLIDAGAKLNTRSRNAEGNTPLMAAVAGGNLSIVKLLLEKGADPMQADVSGEYDALTLAEAEQKDEIASWLRDAPQFSKIRT